MPIRVAVNSRVAVLPLRSNDIDTVALRLGDKEVVGEFRV